jgi:hypothetical protein
MPSFHLAFRAASPEIITLMGDPPTALTLTHAGAALLRVEWQSAALALTARARAGVWHCHRWADATVRPLPPAPVPLTFERGDTYVAVYSCADSAALARFIHLRDYFNAEKMAEAVWAHAQESGAMAEAVIVIEAR